MRSYGAELVPIRFRYDSRGRTKAVKEAILLEWIGVPTPVEFSRVATFTAFRTHSKPYLNRIGTRSAPYGYWAPFVNLGALRAV
jgi:hypothetical protein